eukprot:GHVT01080252.1.p3 GENE.GHVT01080252.1~~GHVT01080252.1.p3  ORF type:complete len:100 (-),score=13.24 GHVT01080252.1:2040-2339(-)
MKLRLRANFFENIFQICYSCSHFYSSSTTSTSAPWSSCRRCSIAGLTSGTWRAWATWPRYCFAFCPHPMPSSHSPISFTLTTSSTSYLSRNQSIAEELP